VADLVAFAAGLATPATLFVVGGRAALRWLRAGGGVLGVLNTTMHGALVVTGAYIVLQERLYTAADVAVAAAITATASWVLWRTNLSRRAHTRLAAVAVLACNLAPLVPFLAARSVPAAPTCRPVSPRCADLTIGAGPAGR
jgi:hypothetical protein